MSVLNRNKVLGFNESLNLQFSTNNLVLTNETYLLQLKVKEDILFGDVFTFNQSSRLNYTVPFSKFNMINGGILTCSLYKVSSTLLRSIANSPSSALNVSFNTWLIPKSEILVFVKPA